MLNIPEAKYPCVYGNNRATFRVVAPDAQKVRVRIGLGMLRYAERPRQRVGQRANWAKQLDIYLHDQIEPHFW